MDDFEFDETNDPLDLLDDDGEGVIEMCTLLNDDKDRKLAGSKGFGCMVLAASSAVSSRTGDCPVEVLMTGPRLFVIFNHRLTNIQIEDAVNSLGASEILEPPEELRELWAAVPPEPDEVRQCTAFTALRDWLGENGRAGDYVLIQGEFGATWLMVNFALQQKLIPIYSTTKRQAKERHTADGGVDISHRFQHVRFRKYQA